MSVARVKTLTDWVMRNRREEILFDDLIEEDVTLDELANLWLTASEWKTAANMLERIINAELGQRLHEEDATVTVGDTLVFQGTTKKEVCVDTHGFLLWLEANPGHATRVINPNSVKKGSLPPGVRDTFFEKTDTHVAKLSAVPLRVLETNKEAE